MNETHKVADVLADPEHEAHNASKEILAKLESGEINFCGCMGPMYGEPYCPCQMKQKGLQEMMDNNPLRIAEDKRAAKRMAEWEAKGGWQQLRRGGKK